MSINKFLEGSRIYLREVRLSDVNDNYYNWMNDPEVTQYLETRFIPQSMENIKSFVTSMDGRSDQIFLANLHCSTAWMTGLEPLRFV